ncbi:MAG: hypothetical protein K2P81_07530 [Bacteriovoracaceae bacterium]|nr:hypothetical protein [Bacteriovoracaceae bacterium]
MLSKTLSLLFIISSLAAFAAGSGDDKRRDRILGIIDEELQEVTRLSKQRNNSDAELLLRAAELHLEKARLQRESENEKFLAIPAEKRREEDQDKFYAQSNRSFNNANQYALAVTKKFPNYKDIADVYYILAFNARELKQYDQSQKYLKVASTKARSGSGTYYKSQLALADSYYNKQKYSKAIPLYESSLSKLDETWWTKDAFNLAWCYYRERKYDKAINLMKDIHKKSANQKYINMQYFVERDLGIFYVDAKRNDEAIAWYKSQGIDFSGHLIKIAKVLVPQGKFTQAEQLVNEAARMQKNPQQRAEILLLQMDLFDKYEKVGPHLKASKELVTMAEAKSLDETQLKVLDYQVAKKAAELQKAASSETYKNVKKTREKRSKQAESYFDLLARLRPGKVAEPLFFKGETAFAAQNYELALASYQSAYGASQNEGNKKIATQSMEGMLATLGQPTLNVGVAEKYYIPVYTAYLKQDSKSDRSKVIRQKLYKVYIDKKDLVNAEAVLKDYAQVYPDDFKTQESMLAGLMEDARKKKDFERVKSFVGQINEGTYKVSKKYGDALRQLMTKIQIEDAQTALDKGDKLGALKNYIRVYNSADSTPRAKSNAAYNLAALYYEAGDLNESYQWSVVALKDMENKEAKQFAESFLTISTNLFLRQKFAQSADLSLRIVAKLCGEGLNAKNTSFKNAAFLWLAEGEVSKAEEVLALGPRCGIDEVTQNEVRIELSKEYSRLKRWDSLERSIDPVAKSKTQAPQAIPFLESLRQSYLSIGDSGKAQSIGNEIVSIYKTAKSTNLDIPVEGLDIIAFGLMPRLEHKCNLLSKMKLEFPEQKFNQMVKQKLAGLDSLTAEVNDIQSTGSGKGIVRAYKLLINAYEDFAVELKDFTPSEKPPEYIESFKKAMASVWTPILGTAQKRRQEVVGLIEKNVILSEDNFEMLAPQGMRPAPYYHSSETMVLMDRGGVQ